MKAAQIPKPGADFQIVEREIPDPGAGHVRIKVQACGVCHSDVLTKDGLWPGIQYPRVPGHEVVGIIDEVGDGVSEWKEGQRVGVGWHGGHDGTCTACRRGDFGNCRNMKIAGISYDGGYQQYTLPPVEALVAIPESLTDTEAAPLLCAGITTFNALRHSGAFPGDLVAVQGIGGLGHLGIQFANKFGYRVAAIGRGSENAALAKKLGASVYIDSKSTNAAEELQKLGGAQVILATAPSSKAMSELIDGLGPNGKLMVIGATFDPIEVTPIQLISGSRHRYANSTQTRVSSASPSESLSLLTKCEGYRRFATLRRDLSKQIWMHGASDLLTNIVPRVETVWGVRKSSLLHPWQPSKHATLCSFGCFP